MKFLKYLLIVFIIVLIVIGAKKVIQQKKLSNESIKIAKVYSLRVEAKELKKENVQLTLPFLALIQSDSDVKLASKISARIDKIAKVGEKVKVGDILIKLDNSDILSKKDSIILQIKTNKDILNNLFLTHKRTKELLDIKGASIEEYQSEENKIGEIKSKIDVLNNSLREIQNLLSYSVIKSPINGVVSKIFSTQGSISTPSKPLLSIAGDSGKYIILRSSSDIVPLTLKYKNFSCNLKPLNSTFNGLDEYSCPIDIPINSGSKISVSVIIFNGEATMVDKNGILSLNNKNYIFIVDGTKAIAKEVKIVASGVEGVVIDGIKSNQKYVVAKPDILLKLLNGTSIKIEE